MSYPLSKIIDATFGVLGVGGSAFSMSGAVITKNGYALPGTFLAYPSYDAVVRQFGSGSDEAAFAKVYFKGFNGSDIKPSKLWFARYVDAATSAKLYSGSFKGVTLTELQAITGVLTISVDGVSKTSSSINLATATSFSNAATMISAAFSGSPFVVTYDAFKNTFVFASTTTGTLSTITFATGTMSSSLKLTEITGALLSQGAAVQIPSDVLDMAVNISTDFLTYSTIFEPSQADKLLFADWLSTQSEDYFYIPWDTSSSALVYDNPLSFGSVAYAAEYNAVLPVYGQYIHAAFGMSIAASTNLNVAGGRTNFAFRTQDALAVKNVTSDDFDALISNHYSFFATAVNRGEVGNFFYNGEITGKFLWADSFVDQAFMRSEFRSVGAQFLKSKKAVPYNTQGYAELKSALSAVPIKLLKAAAIQPQVTLSESQISELLSQAGKDISSDLFSNGWYLSVTDPGPTVRSQRKSPIIKFWYTDGQSMNMLDISSILIV